MSILLAALDTAVRPVEINAAGWATMLLSVASVLSLISFCLYRVFTLPPVDEESIKGPLEIDTEPSKDLD